MSQIHHRLRMNLGRGIPSIGAVVSALAVMSCTTPPTGTEPLAGPADGGVVVPRKIDDPFERVNRGIWSFNHVFLDHVVSPIGYGYRAVVPKPVRRSVDRFGYNLGYPGRALNQLLQGRLGDAGDESLRFLANTTAGGLGFFDVASKWSIPKHTGDFAETFQTWGWEGGEAFLMLPLLGPSDEMHVVGKGFDLYADPLSHVDEARYALYGVSLNEQAGAVEERLRMIESDPDAYSTLQYYWTYSTMKKAPDWSMHAPQDPSTLETLAVATLALQDPDFVEHGSEAKVKIPSTGRKLPFNYWLQDGQAPLVYVVPGLGSHRLTMQALSAAENLHRRGFSVVVISGLFHPEFIELASDAKLPGHVPDDNDDLELALSQIDQWMSRKHGERLGARALVGFSMGGFHTLSLAARQSSARAGAENNGSEDGKLRFQRYIAVNPPVDLHHGLARLDGFMDAPKAWPEDVRQQRADNAVHKAVAMATSPRRASGPVPIDGTESKYLIGLVFRQTLRNALFSTQRRHDMGLLENRPSKWRREPVYEEMMGVSFGRYFEDYVVGYHRSQGVDTSGFKRAGDLRRAAPQLASIDNAQVITSRNDFLLSDAHIGWLNQTFGPKRLVLLDRGGHMGAMADPAFHDLLASRLADLKAN